MTYGCLLRPHREIRELTWGYFTEDLAYIKRSGLRNKSGRNRISAISTFFIFWLEQAAQLKTKKYLKQKTPTKLMRVSCDRDRIRTCDRLLRRQMLYPAELRDQCTAKKKLHVFKKGLLPKTHRAPFNVGVAGFEPATSCSQSRRDNRATLHPVKLCCNFTVTLRRDRDSNPGNGYPLTD